MFRAVAVVCLAAVALGGPVANPSQRIVGGEDADISDFPYMLSLQSGGEHFCGAVIISSNWALTAAHCISGSILSFNVRTNSSVINAGGSTHQLVQKIAHPLYNLTTLDYDIALLRVLSRFNEGPGTSNITLPEADDVIVAGSVATTVGWGTLDETGNFSTTLQVASVSVVEQQECFDAYVDVNTITDSMFCAGADNVGPCLGDGGGPLVVDGVLVGTSAYGFGCARPGYPAVYARVASARDWIREVAGI